MTIKNPLVVILALIAMGMAIYGAATKDRHYVPNEAPFSVTEQPIKPEAAPASKEPVAKQGFTTVVLPAGFVCAPSADYKTIICKIPEGEVK